MAMIEGVEGPLTALPLGGELHVDKMPAHWLMARLGKRVLRPGGREMTEWLVRAARIAHDDDVVELAPGLGLTAKRLIAAAPRSYVGVERDETAARHATKAIAGLKRPGDRIVTGDASKVPLPDGAASLVFGEAMLSMQPPNRKAAIAAEVRRLLRPGGRYAIHELAVRPNTPPERLARIQAELSKTIHVGVRIGTPAEWHGVMEAAGLAVEDEELAPMRLLEVDRLIKDEGVVRTALFTVNAVRTPGAWRRLRAVRKSFQDHAAYLCAIALVARRS